MDNAVRSAPALQGPAPLVMVGQEVAAVGPQEGAEAAPALVGRGQNTRLQQSSEVILGQVEGVVGAMPLATNERIDRIPVRPAQLGERGPRLGRSGVDRVSHPAPVGRGKASPRDGLVHRC